MRPVWFLVAGMLSSLYPSTSATEQTFSYGKINEGIVLHTHPVSGTDVRSDSQYPVYKPPGGDVDNEHHPTAGVHEDNSNYKMPDSSVSSVESHVSADTSRSYSKTAPSMYAIYPAYNSIKKMDSPEVETSTKTISSYEADRGPVYRQQYSQAEPPPYPPLADTSSGEITAEKDDGSSQADMSYLPQPEDYAYYSAANPGLSDVASYQAPMSASDDMMPSSKPKTPKPIMDDDSMGKMPAYPSFYHHSDFLPTKPPDMKMPNKDYDYVPYNADEEDHYLPYNPEMDGHMFGHSPQQTTESEEKGHGEEDLHYHPPIKTKPKESGEVHSHEAEDDDDFGYPFPKFHGKPPSGHEEPSGGKMKHHFHMYPSSDEEEGDDVKPAKGKSKPPPEIYYNGPHKPLHNYDSYLDHEPEGHKDEEDEEKYHHEHEDHNSDYRLNKKPYSYYYLGRKLWYIPLYFSVYFIIYVTALILKSIARHKIRYPITHWTSRSFSGNDHHIDNISANVTKAINSEEEQFMR